jgi:hypothetical protein
LSRRRGSELNLWPEPRRSLEPEWNAERKDELEAKLCQLVCARELDAREAQELIAEDWTAAYQRFFRHRGEFFPPTVGAMTPSERPR